VDIKKTSFEKQHKQLSEVERAQFKKCSFQRVVKNWVKFWRWQWKVIEKKWQERNYTVTRRLPCVI
jgi:hypothetical protein